MTRTCLSCLLAAFLVAGCSSSNTPDGEAATAAADQATPATEAGLEDLLAGEWRAEAHVARDRYRNPVPTLEFFDVQPVHTVIEITPGAGYYTELLAPWLRDSGHYIAAVPDPATYPEERREGAQRGIAGLETLAATHAERFGPIEIATYDPASPRFGEPASADRVLTFRNVHNWRMSGQAEGMFQGFFDVLKPGGVLGVVEHRAVSDVPADDRTGYVGQDQVVALAEAAGFRFDGSSEINANPLDTRDHPNGVWTLPPTNRHDEADAETYRRIGESDRMTLRFVKP